MGKINQCLTTTKHNKANLSDLIAVTGLVISNCIQIVDFSARGTMKFDGWPRKIIGHFFLHYVKLCASFQIHQWIKTGVTVRKRSIRVEIDILSHVTLKFDEWPWKTIGHLFYTTSSFVHHFKSIGEVKLELQSGNAQFGSKLIFVPRDHEIWQMTLQNNRAHLLYYNKLCASFQSYGWIQTGVTVRKRSIRVKIGIFRPAWSWNLTDELENQ